MKERAVEWTAVVACFERYMRESGQSVTRAQFEENRERKRYSPDFRDDVRPRLRPGVAWNLEPALDDILHSLVAFLGPPTFDSKSEISNFEFRISKLEGATPSAPQIRNPQFAIRN